MHELFSCSGSHFFLNGKAEVISADSMAVYKKMDIGTAKPDEALCGEIPHHLINLVDFKTQFSVADFVNQADLAVRQIYERGKYPVVGGGTGFYIRSFLLGLPETPESDENVRNELKKRMAREGREALYGELSRVDPVSAEKIHMNDEFRIIRALEVFYTTGKPRSSFVLNTEFRKDFDFCPIILEPPRELLYRRIAERVEIMFSQGLEAEVRSLIEEGARPEDPGMQAIGYREFFMSDDTDEIKRMIIHNSCKYAKKQYTYIKDLKGCKVVPYSGCPEDLEKVKSLISDFIL